MFLSWVYKRKSMPYDGSLYLFKAYKILRDDFDIKFPVFDEAEEEILNLKAINTHGGVLVDSTKVYAVVQNALKNQTKLQKEGDIMFKREIALRIKEMLDTDPDNPAISIYKEVLELYEKYKNIEQNVDIISPILNNIKIDF